LQQQLSVSLLQRRAAAVKRRAGDLLSSTPLPPVETAAPALHGPPAAAAFSQGAVGATLGRRDVAAAVAATPPDISTSLLPRHDAGIPRPLAVLLAVQAQAKLAVLEPSGHISLIHVSLFIAVSFFVVGGILLLCFRDGSPAAVPPRLPPGEARLRSVVPPAGSRRDNTPYTPSVPGSTSSFKRPGSSYPGGASPGAASGSNRSFQAPSSPGIYPPAGSGGLALSGEAEAPSALCPQLVMPTLHTRLAVPLVPLREPVFEVDVLGTSGKGLLAAALVQDMSGEKSLRISYCDGDLLAQVNSSLEVFGAESTLFGTLREVQAILPPDGLCRYELADRVGRPIMIFSVLRGGMKWTVNSTSGVERARIMRQPAGMLPAEHYELFTNPNVDAVLVLSCFLALVIFELPQLTSAVQSSLPSGLPSGRPSTI
jgi:hypothetical protein